MAGISSLNPYGTYSATYNRATSRVAGLTNSYSPELRQLDALFNNLKLMSGYARSQATVQRDTYRTQIKEFTASAKGLADSSKSLLSLPAQADDPKTTATIRKAVDNFNKLNKSLQQTDNLTDKGRGLYNSLQAAAAVREKDLNTIGIAYNRTSGELTVDETKLKQAVDTDYQKVKEVLGGNAGLAKALDQAVSPATKEPISEYFTAPEPQTANYTQRQNGGAAAYYSAYSRGLLLDLLG